MSTNLKTCVLATNKDNVLLIKEWAKWKNEFAWNTIKGTMDKENESVFECAVREALEEASIEIELEKSLGVHINSSEGGKLTVYFMFTAKVINGDPEITNQEKQKERNENITEVKGFSAQELSELKEDDFVSNASYIAVQKFLKGKIYPLETISWTNINWRG